MPHVVVRAENYIGVRFVEGPPALEAGKPARVTLELMYEPEVDYAHLVPGATFSVREGGKTVGTGTVVGRSSGA